MPRKVYVRLRQDEIDALVPVARDARRHPSDQAAAFVAEALKATQAIPSQDTPPRQPVAAGATP